MLLASTNTPLAARRTGSNAMTRTMPRMTNLFRQLGLDSNEQAIAEFIQTHQLGVDVAIADAPFWNDAQRQFLAEQLKVDGHWSNTVDQLSESLHEDAVKEHSGLR
jgi:hypothetical protein